MKYISFPIPTTTLHDGRVFITDETVVGHPEVLEFVQRFSNYWTRDELRMGWISAETILDTDPQE